MVKDRFKILSILINLSEGSGPFRRIRKINSDLFKITILSLFDNADKLARYKKYTNHQLIGVALKNYYDVKRLKKFFLTVKDMNPDIIHTFHNFSGILGVVVKTKYKKNIFIHSFGTDFKRIKFFFKLLHGLFTLRYADAIVCSSYSVKNSLGYFSVKYRHKIFVIENGVDDIEIYRYKSFREVMRQKFNIPEHAIVIGSVGRLIPMKNHKIIIEAIYKLNRKKLFGKDLRLFIVGDGPELRNLQKYVISKNLTNLVFFTGQVEQTDVYKFLSMMDIYIQVSFWEGMSASVQEAMAMGIPVILSNIPPNKEILKTGGGILVDPLSSDEIADALYSLANDAKKRLSMGKRGRHIIKARYSIDKVVHNYQKLYLKLTKRSSSL